MRASRRSWTRQAIIQTLGAMHAAGRDIAPRILARENRSLYEAALRTFGSYREALVAAGIDPTTVMTFPVLVCSFSPCLVRFLPDEDLASPASLPELYVRVGLAKAEMRSKSTTIEILPTQN